MDPAEPSPRPVSAGRRLYTKFSLPVRVNPKSIGPRVQYRYVTLNVTVAVCPPTSVAVTVTVDTGVALGTLNEQLNVPVELVVKEPLVQVEIFTPLKTRDDSAVDTEKPVPDTVTVAPGAPELGDTVIFGVVTVNVPLTLWPPTSVAFTVVPDVPDGTANAQLNAPFPPVVSEPGAQLVIVFPSNTNPTVLSTENPVPATVTVAPTGPWLGLTVIFSVVTEKVAIAF